jgi:hypothetical protein
MRACLALTVLLITGPLLGEEGQWERVYPEVQPAEPPGISFGADTIAVWDRLTFVYDRSRIVSISKDESLLEIPFPKAPFDIPDAIPVSPVDLGWEPNQLICVNGEYIFAFEIDSEYPLQWENRFKIIVSGDLNNWRALDLPESAPSSVSALRIFDHNNSLFLYGCVVNRSTYDRYDEYFIPFRIEYSGNWKSIVYLGPTNQWKGFPYRESVHFSPNSAWYSTKLSQNGNQIELWEYSDSEEVEPYGRYRLSAGAHLESSYLGGLASPDGERLFIFGSSREIIITDLEDIQQFVVPSDISSADLFFIDTISLVNGWYYLLGSHTLRTKNFSEYEVLKTPLEEPFTYVVGFSDYIYGFSPRAVYRRPLERGIFHSIEMDHRWHHSDWLGWFLIQNEEAGDIDHLLLGKCWVKQTSEQEYWIRTEPLGWIWMNKDWSPWLYRLEDGHWYWLDQDSWPPRAWDDTAKAWMELP